MPASDHASDGERDLMDIVLREIRRLQECYKPDAQLYDFLRQHMNTMDKTNDAFDPIHYLLMYPDLSVIGLDPEIHYRNHGRSEGRLTALKKKGLK